MPRVKLTAAAVARLKAPARGQVDYFDAAYPALALRVTERGVRSWVYFGRLGGRIKRVTLGRFPAMSLAQARVQAGETADALGAGRDPTAARRAARGRAAGPAPDTVAAVAAEWLARDQAGNRSHGEVKRILDKDVLPAWGARTVQSIARRDAIELLDAVADRGAATLARRLHAHLHRMFKWAVARGIVETNPFADIPKPGREVRRDRVLSDAELREVWTAAGALGWPFGPVVQLLALTGARRDEIGALSWPEVDGDGAALRLDGARTKTGEPRTVPLAAPAVAILEALPRVKPATGSPAHVFTTNGRNAVSGWSRAKALLDAEIAGRRRQAAIDAGGDAEAVEAMPGWRLHDLRRTVATGLQRLGTRLEVIEAVLGHVSGSRGGIVGVYQRHAFEDEKRTALEAWGEHVAALTAEAGPGEAPSPSAEVIALREAG